MISEYKLQLHATVRKFIRKQNPEIQKRILDSLSGLLKNPPQGDMKKMAGNPKGRLRLRIGSYRAIFTVDKKQKMIYILVLDNRGDVYK